MRLLTVYNHLYRQYGPQQWWPAETPFEVMVGAVLTQNTAWINVERAIANLKVADALTPEAITAAPHEILAEWLRPSGYFNIKAKRLRNYCEWYLQQGGFKTLNKLDDDALRNAVLAVNGVGPETADDILLYAFERPVFVIDAYTRRIFSRLGLLEHDMSYEAMRHHFEQQLVKEQARVALFNEYHALIVIHAKEHCRVKPQCTGCPLRRGCVGKI
ncbi:MAG: endonuclease III domain-containing protein [Chromatiales bacterium]|nr:endonuclease III domain-containing protein [Chromatiales bacterium]